MSNPVRPSGGPLSPGVGAIDPTADVSPAKPARAQEVAQSTHVKASEPPPVEGSTASVIARLEAGELTREQAIDTLVAQALEMHGGSRLPAVQRSELAQVLRDALQNDPTLGRLLG